MYAKLTMFALVALAACSHVQADPNKSRLPPKPRYVDPAQQEYAPPSYEAAIQQGYPDEQQYLGEQQYGLPVPVAPQVYQAQQYQQQQQAQAGRPQGQFRAHLRALGKSGVESGRRALSDARPALNGLRSDLNGVANRVANSPKVSKLVQAAKPRVENARARAQPLVEKSTKRIGELAAKAQQRLANRGQPQQRPGHVVPVPAQYAAPAAGSYQPAEVYPVAPPSYQ